jgi:hypothetical protein
MMVVSRNLWQVAFAAARDAKPPEPHHYMHPSPFTISNFWMTNPTMQNGSPTEILSPWGCLEEAHDERHRVERTSEISKWVQLASSPKDPKRRLGIQIPKEKGTP